jgi:serine/threonine protein phosphatase PrpC
MSEPLQLTASGWTVAVAASSSGSGPYATSDSHAICSGAAFNNIGRGIIAAVARGIGPGRSGFEAAQIAVHGLAEGYFGATATLSPGRAANLALASVNAWMFSQSRRDPERIAMAAALSAVMFVGRHVRIVHVGDCRVYRRRGRQVVPLTTDHVRPVPDGGSLLTSAIGSDADVQTDYVEDASERSDRYFILSKGSYAGVPNARLVELLTADLPADAAAPSDGEPSSGD